MREKMFAIGDDYWIDDESDAHAFKVNGKALRIRDTLVMLRKAESAGALITPAHDRPWGIYSGYFQDPDGHLWEIIYHASRLPPG